jgi:hypothetical protein
MVAGVGRGCRSRFCASRREPARRSGSRLGAEPANCDGSEARRENLDASDFGAGAKARGRGGESIVAAGVDDGGTSHDAPADNGGRANHRAAQDAIASRAEGCQPKPGTSRYGKTSPRPVRASDW